MATSLKNYNTAGVGTSPITVYNPTATGIQSTIIGMLLVNKTTFPVTASVTLTSGAVTTYLIKDIALPTNNAFELMSGNKIIVEKDDVIQVVSSAAASVDVTLSVVEVV